MRDSSPALIERLQGSGLRVVRALQLLCLIEVTGIIYVLILRQGGFASADSRGVFIFFRLFSVYEGPAIGSLVLFTVLASLIREGSERELARQTTTVFGRLAERFLLSVFSIAIFLFTVWGGREISLSHPLSMDEYGMLYQAESFAAGRVVLPVPEDAREFSDAIRPVFVVNDRSGQGWISGYSPGFSALLTPFAKGGLEWALNPLLTVLACLFTWLIAKHEWPDDQDRRLFAVFAIACCSQTLFVGMTLYAMPAHLAANLAWLFALRSGVRPVLAAGPIGALAMILHQPVPHALFSAPFLLREVREKNWRRVAELGLWYLIALVGLWLWNQQLTGLRPVIGANGLIGLPELANVAVAFMNAILILTWQTPIAAFAFVVAVMRFRIMSSFERDLLYGVLLCLSFYLFFQMITQGHGWGWRYGHQVLGSVILLSASSLDDLIALFGRWKIRVMLALSFGLTAFFQLPLRAIEVRRTTMPFSSASAWLSSLKSPLVVIPADSLWYGRDLVRNSFTAGFPVIVNGDVLLHLSPRNQQRVLSRARRVSVDELEKLGMERVTPR